MFAIYKFQPSFTIFHAKTNQKLEIVQIQKILIHKYISQEIKINHKIYNELIFLIIISLIKN